MNIPSSRAVSDLETHLGYWLRIVSNNVSQSFARKLEADGVTVAEWVFMRRLYDVKPLAPSVLAEQMGMTKGAISKLAYRLSAKGLVDRNANPDDGRAQTLALSAKGRRKVPMLAAAADENDAAFFGCLEASERKRLRALLEKIVERQGLTTMPVD